MLKVVMLLDEDTFEEVAGGAIANECSFAAQARMLIEVGLETLKLDDAQEKAVARRLGGEASASRNGLDTHNSHCLSPNAPGERL